MTSGPRMWNIGDSIPIEIFVADPTTTRGLIGQTTFITLTVQRASDGKFWNGAAWDVGAVALTITEVDQALQPGLYRHILPNIANTQADRYTAHGNVNNPPTVEGDNYELHISRLLDVRVYEAEPT